MSFVVTVQDYVQQELDSYDAYTNSARRRVTVHGAEEGDARPAKRPLVVPTRT